MRVFISWSGDTSKSIAEILKKWIPCFIQAITVFYSPTDIEKGEKWGPKLASELSDTSYGIVVLTAENVSSPWINFEAGAVAKALDSRVTALLVGIKPSDIQGPIAQFQATRIDKDDFYQLIASLNKSMESASLEPAQLKTTFDAIWPQVEKLLNDALEKKPVKEKGKSEAKPNSNAIEEILQLLRNQNQILSSPESIIPPAYLEGLLRRASSANNDNRAFKCLMIEVTEFIHECTLELSSMKKSPRLFFHLKQLYMAAVQTARHMDSPREYMKLLDYGTAYEISVDEYERLYIPARNGKSVVKAPKSE